MQVVGVKAGTIYTGRLCFEQFNLEVYLLPSSTIMLNAPSQALHHTYFTPFYEIVSTPDRVCPHSSSSTLGASYCRLCIPSVFTCVSVPVVVACVGATWPEAAAKAALGGADWRAADLAFFFFFLSAADWFEC